MLKLILLLNPLYVTLFWAGVLSFYSEYKGAPKVFLGKFMIVAFVLYLSHFFYFTELFHIYRFFDGLYIWAMLLVYPVFHIYIRLLTIDKKFSFSKHSIYLALPTIIFAAYTLVLFLMEVDQQVDFYTKVMPGTKQPQDMQVYLLWVSNAARIVFIVQIFFYLIINFKLLIKNSEQVENYYSNIEGMRLHWVQFINISLAITSVSSVFLALAGREAFVDNTLALALPSLVFSFMLFFIGLLGNTQRAYRTTEIMQDPESSELLENNENKTEHENVFKNRMEELFDTEKIFKNPDLKIWDVSQMLGTNRTYVSRLINTEYNRNFCNHVNHYRIEYVKELIKQNPGVNNERIAELSGFGSINSLYRAFQSLEGVSLSTFRKRLKK